MQLRGESSIAIETKPIVPKLTDKNPGEPSAVSVPLVTTVPATARLLRKCLGSCLLQMKRFWNHLPAWLCLEPAGQLYGRGLHTLVRRHAERKPYFGTFFLRNRAELELMRRLLDQKARNSAVHIAVLGCSKGAEVYSIVWTIRSARPDLRIHVHAIDNSQEIVDFAKEGIYSRKSPGRQSREGDVAILETAVWNTWRDQNAPIFARMTNQEFSAMFEVEGDYAKIRPWLKQGITWLCSDAADPELITRAGLQDIVVANCFLCHMDPASAERSLLQIARLVRPGGYLFVSGVDLDVRTRIVRRMGWRPITELIREIHEGDASLNEGWPLEYWGLEPLRDDRDDWEIRYASVFQIVRQIDSVGVRAHAVP